MFNKCFYYTSTLEFAVNENVCAMVAIIIVFVLKNPIRETVLMNNLCEYSIR